MLRDLFKTMQDVESYGLISTLIFAVFFIGVLLYTVSLKKKDVDDFSRIPFEDSKRDSDEV